MHGTATGSATIKITERIDDAITATTTFFHIPITSTTVGTITLSSIASSSPLIIDNDGDGIAEFRLIPVVNGALIVDPFINPIPLTLTPDNKTVILGSPAPPLTVTLSGFQNGDTATSSITGAPTCTTTATPESPVGDYPITCTRGTLDSEKYSITSFATGTLTVLYTWTGFLQPINDIAYNPSQSPSVFKQGSAIPVKFQLKNTSGDIVQSVALPQWLSPEPGLPMNLTTGEQTYTDPATGGATYKWDATAEQYVYNWSTKGLLAGHWYTIFAKLEDGTTQNVVVGIR
jgi:hypothetical protein